MEKRCSVLRRREEPLTGRGGSKENTVWAGNWAKTAGHFILVWFASQEWRTLSPDCESTLTILCFACCSLRVTASPPAVQTGSLSGRKCSLAARHDDSSGNTENSLQAQLWWNQGDKYISSCYVYCNLWFWLEMSSQDGDKIMLK